MKKRNQIFSTVLVSILSLGLSGFVSISNVEADANIQDIPDGYEIIKTYDSHSSESTFSINSANKQIDSLAKVNIEPKILDNTNNENVKVETIKNDTKPLYDLKNKTTGEIVTQYATDVAVKAIGESHGTYSTSKKDRNLSVTAYGTLYYIYSGESSEYVQLDKVSWRYEISDNNVIIKNKNHYFEQNGASKAGYAVNQNKTLTPTANSGTDLVRNWNWAPVDVLGGLWKYGVKMDATIGRTVDNNTWKLEVLVYQAANI